MFPICAVFCFINSIKVTKTFVCVLQSGDALWMWQEDQNGVDVQTRDQKSLSFQEPASILSALAIFYSLLNSEYLAN